MKFSSIKFKLVSLTAICMVIGALVIIYLLNNSYKNNVNLIAKESVKISESAFNNLEKNDTNMLSATLQSLLVNDEIKKMYLEGDRNKLYQLVSPLFTDLKKNFRVTHWYFLTPKSDKEADAFRIHKPTDLSTVKRVTYQKSVQKQDFASGKELGATAFALRVVHPYYDNGKLIGYMELGEEIDHFLATIKKQTGNDYAMLLSKDFIKQADWDAMKKSKGEKSNYNDYKNVVLADSTTKDSKIFDYDGDITKIPNGGLVLEQISKDGHEYVRGIFPIYDAANRQVGGVFVVHDITPIFEGMKETQKDIITSTIILMLAMFTVMLFIINKLIVKRLDNMIDVTTRVVGGDYNSQIAVSSEDEIGQIEGVFEQFRNVFVGVLKDVENCKNKDMPKKEE